MPKKGLSPTQRTMNALRAQGRHCAVAEKWIQAGSFGFRKDLFGFIDVVAIDPADGIIGVQCCTGSAIRAHVRKIAIECRDEAEAWLQAGGKIEVWGWRKTKLKRGGKAMRWNPRIVYVTKKILDGFENEELST